MTGYLPPRDCEPRSSGLEAASSPSEKECTEAADPARQPLWVSAFGSGPAVPERGPRSHRTDGSVAWKWSEKRIVYQDPVDKVPSAPIPGLLLPCPAHWPSFPSWNHSHLFLYLCFFLGSTFLLIDALSLTQFFMVKL